VQHPQSYDRTRNAGFVRGPDVKSGSSGHALADFGFVHQRRVQADLLETMTDDAYWPLPKYRELLFSQ
jgi:glutamine synthetase type III